MADDDSSDALALTIRRWRRAALRARCADAAWPALVAGGTAAVVLNWLNIDAMWASVGIAGAAFALGYRRVPGLGGTAAGLDRRFDSDDLFATAWALRRPAGDDGPATTTTATTAADAADGWRTTLANLAAARAAGLPPPAGLGRRSVRQFVCTGAALVTLALVSRLVPAPAGLATPAVATTDVVRPVTDSDAVVADARRRDADTADEATNVPAPSPTDETAATAASRTRQNRPAASARPAAGDGRADVQRRTAVPDRSMLTASAVPPSNAPGGRGATAPPSGSAANAGGRVTAEKPPAEPAQYDNRGRAAGSPAETPAAEVPAAYRAMVKAFFER